MLCMQTKTHLNSFIFLQELKILWLGLLAWFDYLKEFQELALSGKCLPLDCFTYKLVTWAVCLWKEKKLMHSVNANETWI